MLADRAKINVRGGHGGSGCVSFRREKYIPRGGPDGGDGAPGGDVVLTATRQVADLYRFRRQHHFRAGNGGHGKGDLRHGADGTRLELPVPVGTEVRDADGKLLADLAEVGAQVVVARGGEGGRGNVCFATATRQAPRFAEHGLPGQELWLQLTLKLLADVGLVGLPNAGKSSLLAALTRARPKIASYPFTTLEPNLGVLEVEGRPVVLADIPGLVDGASRGVGLGDRFLAHVERTRMLVFVVDGSEGAAAAAEALTTVQRELLAFKPALSETPAIVTVNKVDLVPAGDLDDVLRAAGAALVTTVAPVALSATGHQGLEDVVAALGQTLAHAETTAARRGDEDGARVVLRPASDRVASFSVLKEGDGFRVKGGALERLVAKADLDNREAVEYVQTVMEKAGVSTALRKSGAQPGDAVLIGEQEFEFL
jgi:GTP-binding protein